MFDIGFGELLLVAVVALVVLGPERLPGAARTLGALVRRARNAWADVRSEVDRELQVDELRNTAHEAAARARQVEEVMRETVRDVAATSQEAVDESPVDAAKGVESHGDNAATSPGADKEVRHDG